MATAGRPAIAHRDQNVEKCLSGNSNAIFKSRLRTNRIKGSRCDSGSHGEKASVGVFLSNKRPSTSSSDSDREKGLPKQHKRVHAGVHYNTLHKVVRGFMEVKAYLVLVKPNTNPHQVPQGAPCGPPTRPHRRRAGARDRHASVAHEQLYNGS